MLSNFAASRRAGAAVEFGLIGMWAVGLVFVIINLALLSFSLGTLAHGVQAAARQAVVTAANTSTSSTSGSKITQTFAACPLASDIAGYFNTYANHGLPSAGSSSGSNPYINSSWSYTSGGSMGLYVTVTGTYTWNPIGFALLKTGIPLTISTWATVPGTISDNTTYYAVAVSGQC